MLHLFVMIRIKVLLSLKDFSFVNCDKWHVASREGHCDVVPITAFLSVLRTLEFCTPMVATT